MTSSDNSSYFLLVWNAATILQHFLFCKWQGIQECLHRRFPIAILPDVWTFFQFAVFLNRQTAVPIFGQLRLPIISSFASHAILPLFRVVEEHTTLKSRWGWLGAYPHIRPRGEEKKAIELHGFRPKRWIVEVAHSWFNNSCQIRKNRLRIQCLAVLSSYDDNDE